jgi:hypothetical protein
MIPGSSYYYLRVKRPFAGNKYLKLKITMKMANQSDVSKLVR